MGKAEEAVPKIASQVHYKEDVTTQLTNIQEVLRFMSYRLYLEMIDLKRRNVENNGAIL